MTLVDTSVWVDHFRRGSPDLVEMLEQGKVLVHDYVIGELACGHLRNRQTTLDSLAGLPHARMATHREVLSFVQNHRLFGKGIGWIDAHLLASAESSGAQVWTLDRRLMRVAYPLGLSHQGLRA
jgi:predicted nucleic acid-binding protein